MSAPAIPEAVDVGIGGHGRDPASGWIRALREALPRGEGLPAADWERRHRGLVTILLLHVVAIPVFGIAQGYGVGHSVLEGAPLLGSALIGLYAPAGQRLRSSAVCLGLMTASGLLVHFSGGYIEFHFHFFVMIVLLSLYVDWFPFLLAVAFVLAHHGIVGVLDPAAVYNHPDAIAKPWKWAGIHAGFILAAAVGSIFTWRVNEEETRRRERLERVTDATLAKLALPQLLDELLARLGEVLRGEISCIWLVHGDELVLRAVRGADGAVDGIPTRMPLNEGLQGRIASELGPALHADVDSPELLNAIHRAAGVRAVAGVPLLVEGTLLGVLDVASVHPRTFTEADAGLLQIVADRIGPLIDRARLYELEHHIATTLQHSLLPKRLPEIPGVELAAGYLPAGEQVSVGGDWYDAIELPGRLVLVMGDIAGHGSEAAALMGQLRTGVHAYSSEGHEPAAVVGRLNELLHGLDPEGMATLGYLDLDMQSWQGRLVTAGHPPPVLVGADGACRYLAGSRGPPLGAVAHTIYPTDTIEIPPGSTLVFYTDGLIERRREPLQVSMDALLQRVGAGTDRDPAAIRDHLIAAATADGPLADDAAVLAVRRSAHAPTDFSLELPALPSSLPVSRRQVEHFLRAAGATDGERYDIVTGVGEACANAIQHAYAGADGSFSITGRLADGAVELTVTDRGRWREGTATDQGGRGLLLMRALMHDVRVERGDGGTRVVLSRELESGGDDARR